jgi:excisionase family DNA binding protein
MSEPCRYMTKAELADRCRVTPRTVERWMQEKSCPPITRLGRRVLFAIEAVEAWEAQKTAALINLGVQTPVLLLWQERNTAAHLVWLLPTGLVVGAAAD